MMKKLKINKTTKYISIFLIFVLIIIFSLFYKGMNMHQSLYEILSSKTRNYIFHKKEQFYLNKSEIKELEEETINKDKNIILPPEDPNSLSQNPEFVPAQQD